MLDSLIIVISFSLFVWLFLILFWGNFWRSNQHFVNNRYNLQSYPTICIIVPARDEANVIEASLTSLLNQDYLGDFVVVLVDDHSCDRTQKIAQVTANKLNKAEKLKIVSGQPLAIGWKGKLWAMHQGIEYAKLQGSPNYWLLTDADIQHDLSNLSQLVNKAENDNLDLVSLMVLLRCQSFWEKLLIPAFVFFFQKLYPFPWVNNQHKSLAAAAGGCILISNQALQEIGGIATIKNALIDDCSLAKAVKSQGKIWLGLTKNTISLRAYNDLKTIWDTIARTAFTQLNYNWLLLIGTVIGMSIVYLVAPIGLGVGILTSNWLLVSISTLTWLLMTIAYLPTIRLYNLSIIWALSLPAIAFLYTLMTIDSALKHFQGKGGAWKGRTYDY
jgi:hopene-associated glycosyltransferase HpnB